MTARDPYAFETYPRGELAVPISRREVFLTALTEARVREGQSRGANAFKLSALGALQDDLLALLTPAPVPGCRVLVDGELVVAHLPGVERPTELFPAESPANSVLDRFDGRTMIEVIGRALALEQGWEQDKAFAYVRGVFLHLITLGVCRPT